MLLYVRVNEVLHYSRDYLILRCLMLPVKLGVTCTVNRNVEHLRVAYQFARKCVDTAASLRSAVGSQLLSPQK
jgi:hypothetical protein